MSFPDALYGHVWHTTILERYESIIRSGFVLPEPSLRDAERWGTSAGPDSYPFVRSLGGVSLFDFREFDAVAYSKNYPHAMWRSFVPRSHHSTTAIWIEVAPEDLGDKFVDGKMLLELWKRSGQFSRKIMPLIEAAYIGPLASALFKRVLRFEAETNVFSPVDATA